MAKSSARLRDRLARYAADRAWRRVAMLRGEALQLDEQAQQRLRFLQSDESLEAREDACSGGELDNVAGKALLQHVAWARVDAELVDGQLAWNRALTERSGQPPRVAAARLTASLTLGDAGARGQQLRACLQNLEEPAVRFLRQQASVRDRLHAQGGTLADANLAERTQALLAESDEPVAEWLHYLARPHVGRGPLRLDTVLVVLRGARLDGLFKAAGRFRRVAAPLRALGFERAMGRCMRAEVDGVRLLPLATVERVGPEDIRVVGHGGFGGGLAELAAMHGAASGLSLSLASPELPWELADPLPDHPCHALGGLFAQLLADTVFLRRVYGLSGKELEEVQRSTALALMVSMRLAAAVTQLAGARGPELVERAVSACRKALQIDCDSWSLPLLCDDYAAAYSRLLGQLAGLRLHGALRERFDEDYFFNPRFAELWMAASLRGNELTIAEFLDEIGADPSWERERLRELV